MDDAKLEELATKAQAEVAESDAQYKALETRMWRLGLISRAGKIPKPISKGWIGCLTGRKSCPSCGTTLLVNGWGYPNVGLILVGVPKSFYYKCPNPTCNYEFLT